MQTEGRRDEEAIRRFIDHFAMAFVDFGFPRMPSRVLAVLSVAEDPGLTAAEIGEKLGVSAGAVSGALRFLAHLGLIVRAPVPGSRRDIYNVPLDAWNTMVKSGVYQRFADVVNEGVIAVGDETSTAGMRLVDMRDFLLHVQTEMGRVVEEWFAERKAIRAAKSAES